MPEVGNMPIPKKLLEQGVRDMVRVSDARMSGTAYGAAVLASGARFDLCDLPRLGVHGNAHFPMLDRNAQQVAQHLLDWIRTLPLDAA